MKSGRRRPRHNFRRRFFPLLLLMLLLLLRYTAEAPAVDRQRKNLLKIQLRTDKDRGRSRVVMRLNQGGYYESQEDRENNRLLIRLFEFKNYGIKPLKVVDDPIVKGVNIREAEQYLEIAVYLKVNSYTARVSLFEKPPLCVADIRVVEAPAPATEAPAEEPRTPASPSPEVASKSRPEEPASPPAPAGSNAVEMQPEVEKAAPEGEVPAETRPEPGSEPQADGPKVAETPLPAGPPATPVEESPSPEKSMPAVSEAAPPVTAPPTLTDASAGLADQEVRPELSAAGRPLPESAEVQPLPPAAAPENEKPVAETLAAGESEEPGANPAPVEPEESEPGRQRYDEGLQAYYEGKFAVAEEAFAAVAENFAESPLGISAAFRVCDARIQAALEKKTDRLQLLELVNEFLALGRRYADHPEAPWAWLQVAGLYNQLEFFYEAAGVYKALLQRFPESPFATAAGLALARLNFSLQRYEEARDDFSRLLAMQPDGGYAAYAHYYLANSLTHLGQPNPALDEYRRGIELDPDFLQRDPTSLYLLGSAYHRLRRYPEAKEYFLMMRNLFPEDQHTSLALAKIGEILLEEGQPAEAMQMYDTVSKEYPGSEGDVVARLKMAIMGEDEALRRRLESLNPAYREYLDSEQGYLFLLDNHPESPYTNIARLSLGRLYFGRRNYPEAREILGNMLLRRLEPGLRDAAFNTLRETIFAEIENLFQAGRTAEIVALQNRYGNDFLSQPGAVYPFLWIGEALQAQGQLSEALRVYRRLKELEPTELERRRLDYGIAGCLLGEDLLDEAATFFAGLELAGFPEFERGRMLLLRARLARKKQQTAEAARLLVRAQALLPAEATVEKIDAKELEADLAGDQEQAPAERQALRQAVELAFLHPELIPAPRRFLLGYRLLRLLFDGGQYLEAEDRLDALLLLARPVELPELLYWQLRCRLARGVADDDLQPIIERMESDFSNQDWTKAAASALQDYRWRRERLPLK